MHPDDDTPPPRPGWLGWALIAFGLLITLGMLNLGVRMVLTAKPPQAEAPGAVTPQPPASANPAAPTAPAAGASGAAVAPQTTSLAGQALVESSDCLRCHGMDRRYVGPSFRQIAARYGIAHGGRLALLEVVSLEGGVVTLGDVERGAKARLLHLELQDLLTRGERLDEARKADALDHVSDRLNGRN